MGEEQVSPERKLAQLKMREAMQVARGRKADHAVELMRETVRLDPTFIEPRRWLAEHYYRTGQARLAVREYEEMLRLEPDNEELWRALKQADPATEERLRRLHNVAPDPFVAERMARASSAAEFDDLGEEDEESAEVGTEVAGAPFAGDRAASTDLFAEGEADEYAYAEPLPWEHDQDREYRDRLDAEDAFLTLLDGLVALWEDEGPWQSLLADCREPAAADMEVLLELNETAAVALDAEAPRLLVYEADLRVPLVLPLAEGTVVLGSASRQVFTNREMVFWLAWACHNLLSGAAEYAWACELALSHDTPTSELEVRINQVASERTPGWNEGGSEERLVALTKLCQAWEQRAVLSADRAGLLAGGEEVVARRAIAGAAAPRKVAADITSTEFLGQFRSMASAELARISLKQNPWTDPQYAAYRSHVIRWWATTDDFKRLSVQ